MKQLRGQWTEGAEVLNQTRVPGRTLRFRRLLMQFCSVVCFIAASHMYFNIQGKVSFRLDQYSLLLCSAFT